MSTNKLHNIKNAGFKVPKDYFASLEDSILTETKLQELANKTGFTTPPDYFNSLEDNILNTETQVKEPKVVKLITWQHIAYVTGIAASILLIVNLFFKTETNTITIEDLETASIENYILEEDLETTEFASLFTNEDLKDVKLISDGYSSETLEDYVFDNLEIEDIITK